MRSEKGIVNFRFKAGRIFARSGGGSGCLHNADHPRGARVEDIFQVFPLLSQEFAIICGKDALGNIGLLTNIRYCEQSDGKLISVSLDEITDVNSDLRSLKSSDSIKRLHVDTDSEAFDFTFRSDSDLFGIWNVLLFVAAHNRSRTGQ